MYRFKREDIPDPNSPTMLILSFLSLLKVSDDCRLDEKRYHCGGGSKESISFVWPLDNRKKRKEKESRDQDQDQDQDRHSHTSPSSLVSLLQNQRRIAGSETIETTRSRSRSRSRSKSRTSEDGLKLARW